MTGDKDVRALQVRCDNRCETDSCKWVGELGDLEQHRSTCPLQRVPCPNKCQQEERKIPRRDLQEHLRAECPNRPHSCPHCNRKGTYSELTTSHTNQCPKIPIICPNSPCSTVITRETREEHERSECLFAAAPCCHSDIGCPARLRRVELVEHEAELQLHLETAKTTMAALKRHVAGLQEGMARLELKAKKELASVAERADMLLNGQTTFKIPEFSLYKANNKEFRSQPFYTRRRGYKLCVIVEPNGTSRLAKGGYMSVYAHLMRGEHDDSLQWPLVGTVTFELLNQLGNRGHRKRSCNFPADDKDNHRLLAQEIADAGYGCPKFISHAKLMAGGGGHEEVLFLKGDAIYLRVSVEAPDPPDCDWLKCY